MRQCWLVLVVTSFVGVVEPGGACAIDLDCADEGSCSDETLTCNDNEI